MRVGRAIALGLAARGCHVAVTYRNSEKEARETVQAIRRFKVKGCALHADQRDGSQVGAVIDDIVSQWGGVDILINNASSFYPTRWDTVTEEQWEDLISTNLTGPWRFAQRAGRLMKKQKQGKIINILDVSIFSPWENYLPYCVAKGGLLTLTRGLAKVLAPEVQVNGIAPGPILFPKGMSEQEKRKATDQTLLKRSGSSEDIVQTVLFFVEGSDFVTGTILPVDGGRLLA